MDSSHLLRTHDNCSSWHRSYTIIELRWCSKAPHMDVFRASRPQFGRVPSVKSMKHRQTRKRSSREAREVSLLLACATDRADYRTFSRFDISISLNLSLGRRMFFSRGKKSRYRFHVRRTSGLPRDIAKIWTSSIRAFSQQGKQKECSELVHARSAVCIACISAARQAFGHMINYDAESHAVKH